MSEHDEQAAFCEWMDLAHPDALYWANPNGAHLAGNVGQRVRQINKLKSEGLLPGVSDIIIAEPRANHHGCFIEFKARNGGTLSENQKWFLAEVEKRGYFTIVAAHGFDDMVRQTVSDYLSW